MHFYESHLCIFIFSKKEESSASCDNLPKPGGCGPKQNNPGSGRQMQNDLVTGEIEKLDLLEVENRTVTTRGCV